MSRASAGLVDFRIRDGRLQILLVHPGGPYFKNKDEGAWSIPKGEPGPGEDLLEAAKREFREEIGLVPAGPFVPLTPIKQKGGKTVHAWACEGDCDLSVMSSNMFSMEWPPRSGERVEFPEIDRAEFFEMAAAKQKINVLQVALIDELQQILKKAGQTRPAQV
jgi:predicted NUDIX family NTP pyrophosphohydrolase